jgi:esterase
MYWIEEGRLAWRFNAPILEHSINHILAALPNQPIQLPALFLAGGKSNYILPADHSSILIQFPLAKFQTIENAGHWVHAEAPQEFLQLILSFLEVVKTD